MTDPNARTVFNSWDARSQDGTTKREQMALEIMHSLVRRAPMMPDKIGMERYAELSVAGADSLIKELNRKK